MDDPRSAWMVSVPGVMPWRGDGIDQLFGQLPGFRWRDAPGDDVAAEDVQHHVKVVVLPFLRSLQLRDVPRPNGIRCSCDKLRANPGRIGRLAAALPDLTVVSQGPVERRHRGQVRALVQQDVEDLGRREVHEPRRAQASSTALVSSVLSLLTGTRTVLGFVGLGGARLR
jgi:hypothetical protein